MKRRDFLRTLTAAAGSATLPLQGLMRPAAASVATTGAAGFHYGWACVFAQMNGGIAPSDIAEKFGIPRADANVLFKRMLDRGVLHPPGLDGRSHATKPWQPWDRKAGMAKIEQEQKERAAQQRRESRSDTFRALMAHVVNDPSYGWTAG